MYQECVLKINEGSAKMFKKKIRIIFIMFLVCIYFMFFISFTNEVYASNTNEEKIYCEVSIDDNFANDCIMVVMNEQSSNYDKHIQMMISMR